jgi:hypothetical protein
MLTSWQLSSASIIMCNPVLTPQILGPPGVPPIVKESWVQSPSALESVITLEACIVVPSFGYARVNAVKSNLILHTLEELLQIV